MTDLLPLLLVLLSPPAAGETPQLAATGELTPQSSSYVKLKGRRLRRFKKSGGASERGRNVSLALSGRALSSSLKRLGRSKTWCRFEEDGVLYYLRRADPYLAQTLRRLRKKPGATVLLKGKVRSLKLDGGRRTAVRVESLQVTRAGRK